MICGIIYSLRKCVTFTTILFFLSPRTHAVQNDGISSAVVLGLATVASEDIAELTDRADVYPIRLNMMVEIQHNFSPTLGMSFFGATGLQSSKSALITLGPSLNIVDNNNWYIDSDLGIGVMKPEISESLKTSQGEQFYSSAHFSLSIAHRFGSKSMWGIRATHASLLEEIIIGNESYNGTFSSAFIFIGVKQ